MATPTTESVVYLALRDDFHGEAARIRQNKPIRNVLKEYRARDHFQDTLRGYSDDKIVKAARKLLKARVFESIDTARAWFPELFEGEEYQIEGDQIEEYPIEEHQDETHQSEDHQSQEYRREELPSEEHQSEEHQSAGVAILENDINQPVNGIPTLNCANMDLENGVNGVNGVSVSPPMTVAASAFSDNTAITKATEVSTVAPSLFPIYLPFRTQHEVLVFLQKLLESSCYEFATRKMPQTLRHHGWDCAEAVELNVWTLMFTTEGLRGQAIPQKVPDHLLHSITSVRHAAVHRERVDGQRILELFTDAEAFTRLLGDAARTATIANIGAQISDSLTEVCQYKESLNSRHESFLQEIAAKRAELDRLEKEAVAAIMEEDQKNLAMAGRAIEDIVGPPEPKFVDAMEVIKEPEPEVEANGQLVEVEEDEDEDEEIGGSEQAEGVAIE